jgi:hypothetical protein
MPQAIKKAHVVGANVGQARGKKHALEACCAITIALAG